MVFVHLVQRHAVPPIHIVNTRADMRVHTWIVVNGPQPAADTPFVPITEPWPTGDVTYRVGASSWTPEAQQDLLAYFTQAVDLPWTADASVIVYDDTLENGLNPFIDLYGYAYLSHADVMTGFAATPSWTETATLFAYPDGGSTYTLAGTVFPSVVRQFNGSDWGDAWGGVGLLQSGGRVIAIAGEGVNNGADSGPSPATTNLKVVDGRLLLHLGGDVSTVGTFPDNWAWSSREADIWAAAIGVTGTTRPAPTGWYMALFDYTTGLELDPAIHLGYARQSVTFDAITTAPRWPAPVVPQRGYQAVSLADVVWTATGAWPRIAVAGLCKGPNAIFDAERPQLWCQYIGTGVPLPPGSTITVPAGILKAFVY